MNRCLVLPDRKRKELNLLRALPSSFTLAGFAAGSRVILTGILFLIGQMQGWAQAQTVAARVSHAPQINGRVEGDVQQMKPEGLNFNSGAVLVGDLYVPGTPPVNLNGQPSYQGTLNGSGSASPTNYSITLNSGAALNHVVRRTDAVALAAVPDPAAPTGTRSVSVSQSGNAAATIGSWTTLRSLTLNSNADSVEVPPGAYGTFIAGNSGKGFILGTVGAAGPQTYSFEELTLNTGTKLILRGPVILHLKNRITINSQAVAGDELNPLWLDLRVARYDVTINANGKLYAYVKAPAGTVMVNGLLAGGVVAADRLTVNNGGVLKAVAAATTPLFASFTATPTLGQVPLAVQFNASASTFPAGGSPIYDWDFGDGTLSATVTAAHSYSQAGDYLVILGVSTGNEVWATASKLIQAGTAAAECHCPLYPIALSRQALAGKNPGDVVINLSQGNVQGTFGWLGWDGSVQESSLPASLTAPGNSDIYINPDNAGDHFIGLGDWVSARPAVANNSQIAAALETLKSGEILVPVWDQVRSQGSGTAILVSGLARIRITGYDLLSPNKISFQFLGYTSSCSINQAPTVRILQPANLALISTFPVSFTAEAIDPDGSVARVLYFVCDANGNHKIGESSAVNFAFSWANPDSGSYEIRAVAIDNHGASSVSEPITISINKPPVVSLTGPAEGAVIADYTSIQLSAQASDASGQVTKVEFYVQGASGNVKVGALSAAPYQVNWTNGVSGSYAITAVATDNQGAQATSAPVHVILNKPPVIQVTGPAVSSVFQWPDRIVITSLAQDPDGQAQIASVQYYAIGPDGLVSIGNFSGLQSSFEWVGAPAGTYHIFAAVTDIYGSSTLSSGVEITVNRSPLVDLVAPVEGALSHAPGLVHLEANARDLDGLIQKVEFFANNQKVGEAVQAPWIFDWSGVAAGNYAIKAVAHDFQGGVATSAMAHITVNARPAVSITAPLEGAQISPQDGVLIQADAADPDGTIAKVEFFEVDGTDRTKLGETLTGPFEFQWSSVPEGNHSLVAVATDNNGGVSESVQVHVTAGAVVQGWRELKEGDDFTKSDTQLLTIPQNPQGILLRLKYPSFDYSSWGSAQDAFEIALLGPDNKPLTATIGINRDAFFNVAESTDFNHVGAVSLEFDGDEVLVYLDLTGIAPGTQARLVSRLVNPDGDTESGIWVRDFQFIPVADIPEGEEYLEPADAVAGGPVNLTGLGEGSGDIYPVYGRTSFQEENSILIVPVRLQNDLYEAVTGRFVLVVDEISDPSVEVLNADGVTAGGQPYFNLAGLFLNGALLGDRSEKAVAIRFKNPARVPFTHHFTLLSKYVRSPQWDTTPETKASVGDTYFYQGRAYDPDGGHVHYQLVSGPDGMSVDADRGDLTWTPAVENLGGNPVVLLARSDSGGESRQSFSILVRDGANSAPFFPSWTQPPRQIASNHGYAYYLPVSDPDDDPVTVTMVMGPSWLQCDNGYLHGFPQIGHLGVNHVIIQAEDDHGHSTLMAYTIEVTVPSGDHAPIFVTEPVTHFVLTGSNAHGYVYDSRAIDLDGDLEGYYVYSLSNYNGSYGVDSTTGRFYWNPYRTGTYYFVIEAFDGDHYTTHEFAVEVTQGANRNPEFVSAPVTYAEAWQPYSYRAAATDPDGQRLSYSRIQGPEGLSVDEMTGQIHFIPTSAQAGVHEVTLAVEDGAGGYTEQHFQLEVGQMRANQPPEFTTVPPQNDILVGSLFRYDSRAVDPDFEPVTYALVEKPLGMAVDAASGTLLFQPALRQLGTHHVTLRASDSRGGVREQSFDIHVTAHNSEPVFLTEEPPEISNYSYTKVPFTLNDTLSHFSGNYTSTTYPAFGDVEFGQVPFTIPAADPNIWFSGANAAVGEQSLEVPVNIFGVSTVHTLINTNYGQPGPNSYAYLEFFGSEGAYYRKDLLGNEEIRDWLSSVFTNSLSNPTSMNVFRLGPVRIDKQATALPEEFRFQNLIRIRLVDNGADVFQRTFLSGLTVAHPIVTASILLEPGRTYRKKVRAVDADRDVLVYSLESAPDGLSIDSSTGILTWQPTANQIGIHNFRVAVSDQKGGIDKMDIRLVVEATAPNFPPAIGSSPRLQVRQGESYTYAAEASDPNGDFLSWQLTQAPAGMQVDADGVITWQSTQKGTFPVSLKVNDGRGEHALQSFQIRVTDSAGNQPPTVTSVPPTGAVIGNMFAYDIQAEDPDFDPVYYRLLQRPVGCAFDEETGALRWVPLESQLGDQTFKVEVYDAFGGLVTHEFTVNVRETNSAPVFESTPPTEAAVNFTYVYPIRVTDPEGDPVTLRLVDYPPEAKLNSQTGVFTWTPNEWRVGTEGIRISATDSHGGVTEQVFFVNVLAQPANKPPEFADAPASTVAPGDAYEIDLGGVDPEGTALTYTLSEGPVGMTLDPGTGHISWLAPANQTGTVAVSILVQDGDGNSTVLSYNLTLAPNRNPVFGSSPVITGVQGQSYAYFVNVHDPDNEPFTLSLLQGPAGMSLRGDGKLSWQIPSNAQGNYPVRLRARDSRGATAVQEFQVSVSADTVGPQVHLEASVSYAEVGEPILFAYSAADDVRVVESGLSINGQEVTTTRGNFYNRVFTQAGIYTVTASAVDSAGNTGSDTIQYRVVDPNDDEAPFVSIELAGFQATQGTIKQVTDFKGTVRDTTLEYYRVEYAPIDLVAPDQAGFNETAYRVLAEGTQNRENAVLAQIDPGTLANGTYFFRIWAQDVSGHITVKGVPLTIASDLKLGRFTYAVTDLNIPLAGIPIQVTRVYDTLDSNRSGDFGHGWTLGVQEARIQESIPKSAAEQAGLPSLFGSNTFKLDTQVTLTNPEGKRVSFRFVPVLYDSGIGLEPGTGLFGTTWSPRFVPEPGVYDKLEAVDSFILQSRGDGGFEAYLLGLPFNPSAYKLTTKDGRVYHYSESGGLLDVKDRTGNTLTFTREGIFSSTGTSITFTRDSLGRITKVTDPDGKVIDYAYDAAGDLVRVTDQAGLYTRFVYHTPPAGPAHYLDKVLDPAGHELAKTSFDAVGRLSTVTDALGKITTILYDDQARTETRINPLGKQTITTYDERGNVLSEKNEIGSLSSTVYDANNNPIETTPPCGCTTKRTYDSNGNVLTETDPMGNVTRTSYDSFNNVTQETDALGRNTAYAYDENGSLSRITDPTGAVTQFARDDFGRVSKVTDALGRATRFEHESDPSDPLRLSKPSKVIYTDGATLQFSYNSFGQVTAMTDASGQTQQLVADEAGKLLKRIDALGHETNYSYNDRGELDKVTNALGQETCFEYDLAGRLTKRFAPIDPEAANPASTYALTRFEYDDLGRLTKTIDPLNRVTEKRYRDDGVVTEIQDPEGKIVELKYDGNKRRTEVIDPSGNRTAFAYDGVGRVKEQTDPLGKKTTYKYDPVGNLVATVDRLGRERGFVYDAANRLTGEKWLDADGQSVRDITLEYDLGGNLIHAEDRPSSQSGAGIYEMGYDIRNRLNRFHGSDGQGPEFELSYTYDEVNRTQTVKQNDGTQVTSTFDSRGQLQDQVWKGGVLKPVKVHLERNALGDVTEALRYADANGMQLAGKTSYEFGRARQDIGAVPTAYLANGDASMLESFKVTEATGPLGLAPDNSGLIQQGSDPLRRITKITHRDGTGQDLMAFDYGFDEAGQLHTEAKNGAQKTYGYDPRGQLTSVTSGQTQIENYTFDDSGNRTSDHRVSTYAVEANNRITSDGTWNYGYDDEGNLVTKTKASDASVFTQYEYDHRNRLISVTKSDGTGVGYAYDFLDRRIYKHTFGQFPQKETHWRYNGDQIWLEEQRENNQSKTSYYLSGEAIDQWVARQDFDQDQSGPARVSWYLTDRMGSIRAQADNAGKLSRPQDYDSFGKPTAPMTSGLGFTGREWDGEAGLYYYRARYYDADLGRFTSEDPIGFGAGDFNLGRYVENNPEAYWDSMGLSNTHEQAAHRAMLNRVKDCIQGVGYAIVANQATDAIYLSFIAGTGAWPGMSTVVDGRSTFLKGLKDAASGAVKFSAEAIRIAGPTGNRATAAELRAFEKYLISQYDRVASTLGSRASHLKSLPKGDDTLRRMIAQKCKGVPAGF